MNTNTTENTGSINKIMETYWSKNGVASSPFELSGIIHKRYPKKKGDYTEQSIEFIRRKKFEMINKRSRYVADKSHIARFQTREQRGFVFEVESFCKEFQNNIKGLTWTFPSV